MKRELLRLEHATQTYSGERVLDDFKLNLFCAEIVSLTGVRDFENDCFMQLFSGQSTLTEGAFTFENTTVDLKRKPLSPALGVFCIRKRANLIQKLTIGENLFVIKHNTGKFFLNMRAIRKQTQHLLKAANLSMREDDLAGDLTVAQQHCIEILRAIVQNAKLIVLEDIAESYTEEEKNLLLNMLREAVKENISVLYLSFYPNVVFQISDRVFLMHRSQHVRTYYPGDISALALSNLVRQLNLGKPIPADRQINSEVLFQISAFTSPHMSQPLYAQLHQGEILGMYDNGLGLTNEILRELFDKCEWSLGSLLLDGKPLLPGEANTLAQHGILLIPSLKEQNAYLHNLDLEENLTLPIMRSNALPFYFNNERIKKYVKKEFDRILSTYFEGDNMQGEYLEQCVLYYRCILSHPRIMVCAPAYLCSDALMHKVISTFLKIAADDHVSAIVFSHEHEELYPLCNRVIEIK